MQWTIFENQMPTYDLTYYPPQAETITYLQCGIHKVQQWERYVQY